MQLKLALARDSKKAAPLSPVLPPPALLCSATLCHTLPSAPGSHHFKIRKMKMLQNFLIKQ